MRSTEFFTVPHPSAFSTRAALLSAQHNAIRNLQRDGWGVRYQFAAALIAAVAVAVLTATTSVMFDEWAGHQTCLRWFGPLECPGPWVNPTQVATTLAIVAPATWFAVRIAWTTHRCRVALTRWKLLDRTVSARSLRTGNIDPDLATQWDTRDDLTQWRDAATAAVKDSFLPIAMVSDLRAVVFLPSIGTGFAFLATAMTLIGVSDGLDPDETSLVPAFAAAAAGLWVSSLFALTGVMQEIVRRNRSHEWVLDDVARVGARFAHPATTKVRRAYSTKVPAAPVTVGFFLIMVFLDQTHSTAYCVAAVLALAGLAVRALTETRTRINLVARLAAHRPGSQVWSGRWVETRTVCDGSSAPAAVTINDGNLTVLTCDTMETWPLTEFAHHTQIGSDRVAFIRHDARSSVTMQAGAAVAAIIVRAGLSSAKQTDQPVSDSPNLTK